MIEKLLSNEIYVVLLAIVVTVFPFLVCCYHYKKYGILQGIFSIITVPMIFNGIGDFICFIFKGAKDAQTVFQGIFFGLDSVAQLYRKLFSFTGWKWLYDTGWIYMPAIVIFVLTYGYSITFYKKRKNKKEKDREEE
ncbi:MAG: hypothetical protein K2J85_06430 [Anaeroplasmataceae bacterium]|nr:hypothetical protein [Anaeroplasmataceae bacterium]